MNDYGVEHDNMGDIDLTLGDVIRILYQRKWFLIAITFVFGACYTGYLLTLDPTYKSESAIAVEAIRDEEKALLTPIPIDVLQDIANAPRTKRQVYEEAQKQQLILPELAFGGFLQRLGSQVREPQAAKTAGPVRVLVLSAEHGNAKVAEGLANTWAHVILATVDGMYGKQVSGILEAARNARKTAADTAREADTLLTSLTLHADLEAPEAVLMALSEQFSETVKETAKQEATLRKLQGQVDVLAAQVRAQEYQGRWVGHAVADACLKTPDTVPVILASLTTSALPVAKLVQWTLREQEDLNRFEFTSGINVKKGELKRLQNELEESAKLKMMADDLKRKREAFREALEAVPGTIVLNKAITDDALWDQHLSGHLPKNSPQPVLRTEEANPAHTDLATQAAALEAQIRDLEKRAHHTEQHEKEFRDRVLHLVAETANLEEQIAQRTQALEDARNRLDMYTKEYQTDRDKLRQTYRQQEEARLVFNHARQQRDALLDEVHALRTQARTYALKMKAAERVAKAADALYEKASENFIQAASQPQVTGETRSPSGAFQLFQAEANPIRIGKSKRKTLIMSVIVFAALAAFAVVVRDGILRD